MVSTAGSRILPIGILIFLPILMPGIAKAGDDFPIVLDELKQREGKALFKATWGRGGRLGTFYDVDADGQQEFIALDRDSNNLSLQLFQIDDTGSRFEVPVGEGYAAGLVPVNLDDDPALEFIVGAGDRIGKVEMVLVGIANGLLLGFANVPLFTAGDVSYVVAPVIRPNGQIDLYDLYAFDDDGSALWHRDLRAGKSAGEAWDETRFQWVVPRVDGSGATILISDDARRELLGLSSDDGSIVWSRALQGDTPASRRQFSMLIEKGTLLPVLFSPGEILVLDPASGTPVYDGAVERGLTTMPSWQVFGDGDHRGYLVFGDNRSELRMISLLSGKVLWSHTAPGDVLEIVPLNDGERFIAVLEDRIRLLDADGTELADYEAPAEIKTKYPPVYRDLDGDGVMELVFVSGKHFLAWRPATDELLWDTSLSGLLGGAHPVELYDAFEDIDGDGWLDVPGKKGGGTGVWLSGRTGEFLTEVGNGSTFPIVGDWNGNGRPEIFWYKTWYEVPAPAGH